MKLPQSSRVHCNRIKTPPRRANHCEEIGAWASMSPMKIWRRPILFGVIVTLGVLGALKLHNANAQTTGAVAAAQKPLYARLAWKRMSPSDLEIDGDLRGGSPEQPKRFVTRDQLLSLPQISYTVTNDANFRGPTQISGVALDELIHALAANPDSDIAVAICSDGYATHYDRS